MAARLAAQKQQAENPGEGGEKGPGDNSNTSNPFVLSGFDDDHNEDPDPASPTVAESGFSPPDSLSNSSEEDGEARTESVRRKIRMPLEVDEDDDEMGEMVGPSVGSGMMDSDDEDEAIINESMGYPNIGADRYKNLPTHRSPFDDDNDEQNNDSSDGEDDGLVEILVPGRRSSSSSNSPSQSRSKSDQFMVS